MARLQSKFSFRDPRLLAARVKLDDDSLILTGWNWLARYRRRIDLTDIVHVDVKPDRQMVLWLIDGEVVRLRLKNPSIWKNAIEDTKPAQEST